MPTNNVHLTRDVDYIRFLVIEGPAGCGKSTIIKKLTDGQRPFIQVPPVTQFERPRSYVGAHNLALSQIKDLTSFLSICLWMMNRPPELQTTIPVVDRWMISQMVYGRLRRSIRFSGAFYPEERGILAEASFELIQSQYLYQNLMARDGQFARDSYTPIDALVSLGLPRLEIYMAIVLPSHQLLQKTRQAETSLNERKYPYPAADEIQMYHRVSGVLMNPPKIRWCKLMIQPYPVDSMDDLNQLPLQIHRDSELVLRYRGDW